jgi:hypothetical protein
MCFVSLPFFRPTPVSPSSARLFLRSLCLVVFIYFTNTSDTYDQCSPVMNHVQDQDGGLACDVKGRGFRGIERRATLQNCREAGLERRCTGSPAHSRIAAALGRRAIPRRFDTKTQDGSHELPGDIVQVGAEYRVGGDRYSSDQGDTRFLLGNVSDSRRLQTRSPCPHITGRRGKPLTLLETRTPHREAKARGKDTGNPLPDGRASERYVTRSLTMRYQLRSETVRLPPTPDTEKDTIKPVVDRTKTKHEV